MVKKSASKIKQDNTTRVILVKNNNRQGSLEELSLSYTSIKAYRTAVLGGRDLLRVEVIKGRIGIRYCTIGWFQIVILRMASVLMIGFGCEVHVSRVHRVSSVGVTDGSSLTGFSMGA